MRIGTFFPLRSLSLYGLLAAAISVSFATNATQAQGTSEKATPWSANADREKRVADLISKMTLEEKAAQMQNHAPAIPRLGIPEYDYWSEGLHGIARSGNATLFPQAIGLAATWDTELMHAVGTVISTEARAKYNQAIREDNHDIYYGLTVWSPNINIFRDPRWGRGQETYGEDPYLTGRMGVAFVTGLQGDDPNYLRVIATPKHFAVHSGPESSRHRFNVDPSPHDLEDTYLPAFRATITEAHAQSIMCAYNSLNGAPACANEPLLKGILRDQWKFKGFVTSDCGAVGDVTDGHKFAPDLAHASVVSVRAGTDTSCGTEYATLAKAVKDGLISEEELDVSLQRLFDARFELGMFDPASKVDYASLPFSQVDSEEHRALALKTARESIVLLKNEGHLLPLAGAGKTIAVIGPNADSLISIEGNYNAIASHPVTPLDGLRKVAGASHKIVYAQGSSYADTVSVAVPQSVFTSTAGKPGLKAEYFSGSSFSGSPKLTRTDGHIDFDWNAASPAPGVPMKDFAVRWTGNISAPAAGAYPFSAEFQQCYPCADAEEYTVYVDDKQVAHQKFEASASRASSGTPFTINFSDTKPHAFRFEYAHSGPRFGAGVTFSWKPPVDILKAEAVAAAEKADVVVAFVGLSPLLEGEEMPVKVKGFDGGDRTDLELPAQQQELLEAVAKTGKPLVVVLLNGSALAVNWAQQHAGAILEAWYPGEEGGTAIAKTLLGKSNPSGRLPLTFYSSISQLPAFDDYSMHGRTYRYFKGEPLYRFGDGLSYTNFTTTDVAVASNTLHAGDPLALKATVTNTGKVAGDEVVEAYLVPPASEIAPIRKLVGFTRVHLLAGEHKTVSLTISPRQLSQVDAAGKRSIQPGEYQIFAGGSQPGPSSTAITFHIEGTQSLPE